MSADRKIHMIVNPNSANGSTRSAWPSMESRLKEKLGTFDWAFTERPREATHMTRKAIREGYDAIVAVGGDGTNNEVINGFFDGEDPLNPECAFGFICRGTGGDFRKTFGWNTDLEPAVERLAAGKTRPIDIGRMTYRDHDGHSALAHFINITSFGMSGLVDHYVNHTTKVFGGKASFLMGTLRALIRYKNQSVRLKVDDRFDDILRINVVAVGNGRFFGGGMKMTPKAEVDDGLFDITVLGDMSLSEMIANNSAIYKGAHIHHPKVLTLRGSHIVAESADGEDVLIDMDGEQPGKLPCVFDVLPGAVKLLS